MFDDRLEDDDAFDGDGADADLEESLTAVPVATLRAFLAVAVLSQAGLLAVSLGAMLAGFREQWALGGGLVVAGALALVAAAAAYVRYRPS